MMTSIGEVLGSVLDVLVSLAPTMNPKYLFSKKYRQQAKAQSHYNNPFLSFARIVAAVFNMLLLFLCLIVVVVFVRNYWR
jgi:hypothetical protein